MLQQANHAAIIRRDFFAAEKESIAVLLLASRAIWLIESLEKYTSRRRSIAHAQSEVDIPSLLRRIRGTYIGECMVHSGKPVQKVKS